MKRLPALALALVACATAAAAFERETTEDRPCTEAPGTNCEHRGIPLEWRDFPVRLFVNADLSGVSFDTAARAIEESFRSWQTASADGITFSLCGSTSGGPDGQDRRNTVFWQSFGGEFGNLARSTLTYQVEDGKLLDVDIALNADFDWAVLQPGETCNPPVDPCDLPVDIQAVVTHEAGHLLGLDHENRFGTRIVMYFSDTPENTTHRSLTADDRSGVRVIYTAGGNDGGDGCGGGGGGGGCAVGRNPALGEAALALVTLAWLGLRRRRGRRH